MAVSISRSSGGYYTDGPARVWDESRQFGVEPFWVLPPGKWKGDFKLPAEPDPDILRTLTSGVGVLDRVQANRARCFEVNISEDKILSFVMDLLPPEEARRYQSKLREIDDRVLMEWGDRAAIRVREDGNVTYHKAVHQFVGFDHGKDAWGRSHRHRHYVGPNVAEGPDGKLRSVGNTQTLFALRGLMDAVKEKLTADFLKDEGWKVKRVGNRCRIVLPAHLTPEKRGEFEATISPGKALREEVLKAMIHRTPRAIQAAVFEARRKFGLTEEQRAALTPEDLRRDSLRTAQKFGLSVEAFKAEAKKEPVAWPPDRRGEQLVAYRLAIAARDDSTDRYHVFTREQFTARLYVLGIDKPVTFGALEKEAESFLANKAIAGISRAITSDGQELFSTERGRQLAQEAAKAGKRMDDPKDYQRAAEEAHNVGQQAAGRDKTDGSQKQGSDRDQAQEQKQKSDRDQKQERKARSRGRSDGAQQQQKDEKTARPSGNARGARAQQGMRRMARGARKYTDSPEEATARKRLKLALKAFKTRLVITTMSAAATVIEKLTEKLSPKPVFVEVDARNLRQFLKAHRKTPAVWAHTKAITKGIFTLSPANAERWYAYYRTCQRLKPGSFLLVKNSECATRRQLADLDKLARRDGAHTFFVDRPDVARMFREQQRGRGPKGPKRQPAESDRFTRNKER